MRELSPRALSPRALTMTRRGVLMLGLGAGALVLGRPETGWAERATVDGFSFDVPTTFLRGTADSGWAWQATWTTIPGSAYPSAVVQARADVASTDAEEVLALLVAGAATGQLPELRVRARREREVVNGETHALFDVTYDAAAGLTYDGTILVSTRSRPPAAVLVVLGDDKLTAGTRAQILDSGRWQA